MVWLESESACKTSLGQMISVQFCHKSLNVWLWGACASIFHQIGLLQGFLKEKKMGVIRKCRFFLKNALMIHSNVKSKSVHAAGKVVHFEWKDQMCMKIGER